MINPFRHLSLLSAVIRSLITGIAPRLLVTTLLVTTFLTATVLTATVAPPAVAEAASLESFNQGITAYQQRNYRRAIDAFTRAIEQNDGSTPLAAAYGNRCLIELELEAYSRAIADCTHSLQLNPAHTESHLNRGLAYYRVNDYAAAIEDYNRRLEQVSDDHRAFYNRGLAQAGLHRYQQAIADYNQAIRLTLQQTSDPMAQIYADRGLLYLELEQYREARLDFSQAIAYDGSDAETYFNRAYAVHCLGNDLAALRDLKQVLTLDPTHAKTYFNLGLLRYQLGQTEVAIASFEQAAYHFFTQNNTQDYARVMAILNQLQRPSALG